MSHNYKLSFESEKNVTVDDVVNEADAIWKYAKSKKIKFGDEELSTKLLKEVEKSHPEFCQAYPIVNRYICQMQEYSSKALRMWLNKIKINPWKTEAEYLDATTDYVVILYKFRNPKYNMTDVSRLRKNVRDMLQKEHDEFKKYAELFKKEVENEESNNMNQNIKELEEFVRIIGVDGLDKVGTVKVVVDDEINGGGNYGNNNLNNNLNNNPNNTANNDDPNDDSNDDFDARLLAAAFESDDEKIFSLDAMDLLG
jgi:hypothetical protein